VRSGKLVYSKACSLDSLKGPQTTWGCYVWLISRASTRRYLKDLGLNIGRISMKGLMVLVLVFGEEYGVSWTEVLVPH
jgi:hypothetical protein